MAGGEAEMKKSSDSACILGGSSLFPPTTPRGEKSGNIHLSDTH